VIYLATFLTIATFVVALWLFGIVPAAAKALEVSRAAAKAIRDSTLSEEEKERTLQKSSLVLLRSFLSITARGAAALGVSLVPMLAFDLTGLAGFWVVADFAATWEVIIVASVLITLVYLVGKRL